MNREIPKHEELKKLYAMGYSMKERHQKRRNDLSIELH